ncbi:MAG TPA: NAD(P)H-dependent oxidoreductase subunit E [Thermoanaerobaculia bacterium]
MTEPGSESRVGAALVVGGGIGGMQAALDLADSGIKVYLVDSKPAIGGIMSQLDKTFPTNDCAMCTIAPRLVGIGRHKDIEILTMTDVERVEGQAGRFVVRLKRRPRYVDASKCTGCGLCVAKCPVRLRTQPLEPRIPPLSPERRAAVDAIVAEHRDTPGPLLLILQSINALYNYFPQDVLRYVSWSLNTPLTQVLRIATFYNAFSLRPRGRHTINVCMGTTCYVRNGERILDKFSEVLGIPVEETTADSQFTLKAVRCVGCCSIAPVLMIDGKAFGRLKVNDVPLILHRYAAKATANGQAA